MNIKVVYAKADRQHVIDLDVGEGTTVYQAAEQSGLAELFLKLILKQFQWCIWCPC